MKIDPEQSIGFLINRVAYLLKGHICQFVAEAGIKITAEELAILTGLAGQETEQSMNSLSTILGRDPTTLKRQLDGLVEAGLVQRMTSPKDRRVVLISITQHGRELVESTLPLTFALRDRTLAGVSEADRKILRKVLVRMKKKSQLTTAWAGYDQKKDTIYFCCLNGSSVVFALCRR